MKYHVTPSSRGRVFPCGRTDGQITRSSISDPISFNFQLKNRPTSPLRPGHRRGLFPVFLYSPDDGDRRLSKVSTPIFHMTRCHAQEACSHQHHYGNLKSRTGKWKCLLVWRFSLVAQDAVATLDLLMTRIFLCVIPPLLHSRPRPRGRHWASGRSSQSVLQFRAQAVQVSNFRPASDSPHWGVFSSVPPGKCRDIRDFRLSPRCKWYLRSSKMLRRLAISYRHFRTTFGSHFQGSISPRLSSTVTQSKKFEALDPWRWDP